MDQVPVLDVSNWSVETLEAGGRGGVWLKDPSGSLWLYKPNRIQRNSVEQGEDWAEKAVSGLAALIGVPSAHTELAVRAASGAPPSRGVVSRYVAPPDVEVHAGAVLLTGTPGYRMRREDDSGRPPKDHVGHTLENVARVLSSVGPPVDFPEQDFSAFDVFAGYLLLDAWVANQDRHEENWAVVDMPGRRLTLAPSFDHGASLGFSLPEDVRQRACESPDALLAYARRGRAAKFEGRTTSLVAIAGQALARTHTRARTFWLERLDSVTSPGCASVLSRVPRMSDLERTFCLQLLSINRRRILDEHQ